MSKSRNVKDAVMQHPLLIPFYLRNNHYNKKITKCIMRSLVPFSVGIEIECMKGLITIPTLREEDLTNHREMEHNIVEIYNIKSFSQDVYRNSDASIVYTEHRIRIKDYSQLPGLYKILELMKETCEINKEGGLHLHIDVSEFLTINGTTYREYEQFKTRERILVNGLEKKREYLVDFFQYQGNNKTEMIGMDDKAYCITTRSDKGTVEFRMGHCTFDYEKIVKWIVVCSSIVRQITT